MAECCSLRWNLTLSVNDIWLPHNFGAWANVTAGRDHWFHVGPKCRLPYILFWELEKSTKNNSEYLDHIFDLFRLDCPLEYPCHIFALNLNMCHVTMVNYTLYTRLFWTGDTYRSQSWLRSLTHLFHFLAYLCVVLYGITVLHIITLIIFLPPCIKWRPVAPCSAVCLLLDHLHGIGQTGLDGGAVVSTNARAHQTAEEEVQHGLTVNKWKQHEHRRSEKAMLRSRRLWRLNC